MKTSLKTGGMPRVKPGDYERALALMVELGGDKQTRAYLEELVAATKASEQASADATAAMDEATKRSKLASAAEADATVARQKLADDTAKARTDLGKRETAVAVTPTPDIRVLIPGAHAAACAYVRSTAAAM